MKLRAERWVLYKELVITELGYLLDRLPKYHIVNREPSRVSFAHSGYVYTLEVFEDSLQVRVAPHGRRLDRVELSSFNEQLDLLRERLPDLLNSWGIPASLEATSPDRVRIKAEPRDILRFAVWEKLLNAISVGD